MNKGKLLIMGLFSLALAFGILASCDNGVLDDVTKYDTDKGNAGNALGKVNGAKPSGGGGDISDNRIVGTWTGTVMIMSVEIVFNSNGTGSLTAGDIDVGGFNFSLNGSTITANSSNPELGTFSATVNFSNNDNTLTLTNVQGGNTYVGYIENQPLTRQN